MSVDAILSRLDKVNRTGADSWIACCPAHDDRQPSLGVRDADNGCILLRCHAGCSVEAILSALGLAFDDLFAAPLAHHRPPIRNRWPARDVLECVAQEALIVAIVAQAVADGKAIPAEDLERYHVANRRLNEAAEVVRG